MKKILKNIKPSTRKPKPHEFMAMMERLRLIDQEIKKETGLYETKIKSFELEKEYLWHKISPDSQ